MSVRVAMKILTFVLATFALLTVVKGVSAQTSSPSSNLRQLKTTNSCNGITTKITNEIDRWTMNEPKKVQLYQDFVARIQATLTLLQDKGYDISKVQIALEDLNKAILLRHTDAVTLIDALKTTQTFACGSSQGQFRDAVLTARKDYATVRLDTFNIRKVWLSEVRPAIVELRTAKLVSPSPVPSGQ